MKVSIKHTEKKTGMVFKTTHYGVTLSIDFNDEERAIIADRKLQDDLILERDWGSDIDGEKKEERGLASKLLTAATKGADANHPHLTINKLLIGPDTHHFSTPAEAKMYEAELKEVLPKFKDYIMGNAELGSGDSFEL